MKPAKSVLMLTIFLCLSLITSALPQKEQAEPTTPVDQDRIEAAHGQLLSGKDNAAEASRLTQTVAPCCRTRLPLTPRCLARISWMNTSSGG